MTTDTIITNRQIDNPEDSLPAVLLAEDLTGDGFDDLIITFDDGNGRIYILPGRAVWETPDLHLDMAVVVNGTAANPIGEFLVTGDSDEDGELEIFSSNGTSASTRILTSDIIVDSGNADNGNNLLGGSARLSGSGRSCNLNAHEQSPAPQSIFTLCLFNAVLIFFSARLRRRKTLDLFPEDI